MSFPEWVATSSEFREWEGHFTPQMLAISSEIAVRFVLGPLKGDIDKSASVLSAVGALKSFGANLFDYVISNQKLAKLIPNLFANVFQDFPVAALHRCIECADIDQNILLFHLSSTSNPLHRSVHAELIQRVLNGPINLYHIRYVANMLRGHTTEAMDALIRDTRGEAADSWLWLVRGSETARGERLIDERGNLLRKPVQS